MSSQNSEKSTIYIEQLGQEFSDEEILNEEPSISQNSTPVNKNGQLILSSSVLEKRVIKEALIENIGHQEKNKIELKRKEPQTSKNLLTITGNPLILKNFSKKEIEKDEEIQNLVDDQETVMFDAIKRFWTGLKSGVASASFLSLNGTDKSKNSKENTIIEEVNEETICIDEWVVIEVNQTQNSQFVNSNKNSDQESMMDILCGYLIQLQESVMVVLSNCFINICNKQSKIQDRQQFCMQSPNVKKPQLSKLSQYSTRSRTVNKIGDSKLFQSNFEQKCGPFNAQITSSQKLNKGLITCIKRKFENSVKQDKGLMLEMIRLRNFKRQRREKESFQFQSCQWQIK